ncbi:MAG: ClpXP protease specificity-enhancing factor [Alcanivoracaceae bacterium]|jgi:stringent starvation protein B|nr:ClpXP protease specificity-enhancing factor [Alcanivoracaceae bacterium]
MTVMTPNRPYLIRAMYDWICDNGLTPHLAVDAHYPGARVPQEFVQDGQIVLNLAPRAVQGLVAGNEEIIFSARFGGIPRNMVVPVGAVLAIYARENGQGMAFSADEIPPPPEPDDNTSGEETSRPSLRIVK